MPQSTISLNLGRGALNLLFLLSLVIGVTMAQTSTLTIGMTLSLTHYLGPTAQQVTLSKSIYDGLLLWHRNLPAEGLRIGNQTYRVQLDIRNDNGNATIVSSEYKSMVSNSSIDFFFAPVGVALTLPAKEVTEAAQRLLVVAAAAGKSIYENSSWTFQAVGSATNFVRTIVPTMRIKGASSIAFVYEPYRSFCSDILFGQEKYLSNQKISLSGSWETFQSLGAPVDPAALAANMTGIARELAQMKPDVVLGCLLSGEFQEALLRAMSSVGWVPKMFVAVPDFPVHFSTVDNYTSNFMINLPGFSGDATFPHNGENFNDSKTFGTLFRNTYGYEAETFSALGAQQGLLLQNALQRAGSLNQAAVRDAMRLTDLETFLGRTTFNVDGSNNLQLLMVQKVNNSGIIVSPPLWANGEVIYPMPLWSERNFSRSIGEPVEVAVMVLTAVGMSTSLLLFIPLIMNWNHPIIAAAAPTFLSSILLGTILLYLSNFAALMNLTTFPSCHISIWLLCLGFIITFGSLFAKSWRVWRLYSNKSMTVIKISDGQVMSILGVFVGIMVVLLIILSAAGDPRPIYVSLDPYRPHKDYLICGPSNETAFNVLLALILGYGLAIIVIGVVVSFKVRQVPIAIFDESRTINFVIYNVSFFSILLAVLRLSKVGSRDVLFAIQSVGIIICILITVVSLFFSRFAKIWSQKGSKDPESPRVPPGGKVVTLSTFLNANGRSEREAAPSVMAVHGSALSDGDFISRSAVASQIEDDQEENDKLRKKLRRRERRIAKLEKFILQQGYEVPR
eukprot:TRINITY_DN5819_c0_g1_i1.p1 TRINITY_DN5819_c0_g1~~TRINITY_DN5819_c0_g1_i1.p1  ORF type:complete len:790 (-),score=104.43 TRINITY_DN5819_c0_g1_i1:170-2539(-)